MNKAELTFAGGADSVTGANFILDLDNTRIAVDCGLEQGSPEADEHNRAPFGYDPSSVDYLFITHAHLDHIGRVPKLVREGFRGVIYSTPVTRKIVEVMFEDALGIMEHEQREDGTEPLYERADVERALELWQELAYHDPHSFDGFRINAKDAGHILGSAMFEITVPDAQGGESTIVFTGDLGNSPAPLIKDTEAITGARYMVMESVYGDRDHESPEERDEAFREHVKNTIERGGTLVIPAFSLERTQIILHALNRMIENGEVQSVPVFLDSPLAIKLTRIFEEVRKHYNEDIKQEAKEGDPLFSFPSLEMTERVEDSKAIEDAPSPKIVIAGSGMSTGGRVMHHELDYLPDPANTLLLVGYQAAGTLGRKLAEGAKEVEIFDKQVPVRAEVAKIEGYSSHKDSGHLLEFVAQSAETLETVFLAMGEQKSRTYLAQRIRDFLGVKAVCPDEGETVRLKL